MANFTKQAIRASFMKLLNQRPLSKITVDALPNENASEYARNNYTLEAMAVFNQDDILSLEALGPAVRV